MRVSGIEITHAPPIAPEAIGGRYEIFITSAQNPENLTALRSVPNWRRQCRTAACLISDASAWLEMPRSAMMLLRRFDHLFVTCEEFVEPLRKKIGISCHALAPGIDALRFCPFPERPKRWVDVYCIGQRPTRTHDCIYEMAKERQWMYLYDSGRMNSVGNPMEHRGLLSTLIQRARYFLVYPRSSNSTGRPNSHFREISSRYMEGAAGGAVLLGEATDSDEFRRNFDWADAVVSLGEGCKRVRDIFDEMEGQGNRIEAARRTNVMQCLRRHDWLYRWKQIVGALGLSLLPRAEERTGQLGERIRLVQSLQPVHIAEVNSSP
jgi:hypothetical protein